MWQKLKFDIPYEAQEIASKREELRVLRENVLLVVRDYNSILETLTPERQNLFRDRIRFLDRKIQPGMVSLTWGSKGITEYFVRECRRHSHDVQKSVAEFALSTHTIQQLCRDLSDTLLCRIESKKIYDLEEFDLVQRTHREITQARFQSIYNSIRLILAEIHTVFKNDGADVKVQWAKFVETVDADIEEALRVNVKRSLTELSKSINGEGGGSSGFVETAPLFKFFVVLDQNQKLDFQPPLQKLEETVHECERQMIALIKVVPRLAAEFTDASDETRACEIIAREDEITRFVACFTDLCALAYSPASKTACLSIQHAVCST